MNLLGEDSPIGEISTKKADKPSQEQFNECFSAYGAAFIVRRKIIDKIGLFNRRFYLDYEDTDFSWRLRLIGYKIVCVHSSRVYHLGRATKRRYTQLPLSVLSDTLACSRWKIRTYF